jgi:amino acid transporter
MIDYFVVFFTIFFADIFYTYYLKAVHEEKKLKASFWATLVYVIAATAIIEYNSNHMLLIPAGLGAFFGTWVGMKFRKKNISV